MQFNVAFRAGSVGIFVEWIYDWPSKPENGEDNPRTLSFKETVGKVCPATACGMKSRHDRFNRVFNEAINGVTFCRVTCKQNRKKF